MFEEDARSIVAENQSPDIPFRWSLNPYRGCFHGCAYCYARPTHQYLGFGAGTDFERRIVVKRNAAALLRQRLARASWRGEHLVFSGVTDCYQPLEASYGLTRACLEVCAEFRQPVGIITKGALVERDVDLLAGLAAHGAATVFVSVPFFEAEDSRRIEPFVALPERRLRALRTLAEVYRRARQLWPLRPSTDNAHTVTIRIDLLKELKVGAIVSAFAEGDSWLVVRKNELEGVVERHRLDEMATLLGETVRLGKHICYSLCPASSSLNSDNLPCQFSRVLCVISKIIDSLLL